MLKEEEGEERRERRSSIMTTTPMSVPDYSTGGAIVSCASVAKLKPQRNSKRRRHHCSSPAASSSSSHSSSSTTTQKEEEDEEEDMAKCLILLAQGPAAAVEPARVMPAPVPASRPKNTSRRFFAAAEAGGGVCVSYECKTCNKCFPSFQALGGHRTSHNTDKKQQQQQPRRPEEAAAAVTTTLSLRTAAAGTDAAAAAATRPAHECSSLGAVFASGQALGGHMRRHRPLTTSSSAVATPESVVTATGRGDQDSSKLLQEGNINLELDLNLLPAPSTEQELTSPAKPPCHEPAQQFS